MMADGQQTTDYRAQCAVYVGLRARWWWASILLMPIAMALGLTWEIQRDGLTGNAMSASLLGLCCFLLVVRQWSWSRMRCWRCPRGGNKAMHYFKDSWWPPEQCRSCGLPLDPPG